MKTLKQFVSEYQSIIEGGQSSERQERAFVDTINKYAKRVKGGITVNDIDGVVSAKKVTGLNVLGTEPYTDVALTLTDGSIINVSLKGGSEEGKASAPSVAGGGLVGLQALIPDLISTFLEKANEWYIDQGYKKGDVIPDVYGELNRKKTELVLRGTEDMGGPVDYIYVGPMDVKVSGFDGQALRLNGTFHEIAEYAKHHSIFFRLRKRREDQPFEPKMKDASGSPLILGRSPSKGDTGRRIVMVSSVPKSAAVISI